MKLNYLTLEIEKIENDIANGKSSLSYKERLIEFKAIKQALTIPVVVKQSELFKCRNVACKEMTNRDNETVFCDKHKPYLGI